jgi:hypothetical protein
MKNRHTCQLTLWIFVATLGLVAPRTVAVGPAEKSRLPHDRSLMPYSFDRAELNFADILTLKNGTRYLGKVLEWADKVILYHADGRPQVYDVAQVEQFEFRRFTRHHERPDAPDLTVAFVERLPRDPSWHGHVRIEDGLPTLDLDINKTDWTQKVGSRVTFKVHVLNAGRKASQEVPFKVFVDTAQIQVGKIPAIKPGGTRTFECPWDWQSGSHTLHVEIDPDKSSLDVPRWNNSFAEPVQAVALDMVVDREVYERFAASMNMVDTYCFEDWLQYNIRALNGLFFESRYPTAPDGIKERVRLDRLVIVDDPLDEQIHATWANSLRQKGQAGGLAEYGTLLVMEDEGTAGWSNFRPLKVDWKMLQLVASQLGLVDLTRTDTRLDQCLALDHSDLYVQRQHFFPYPRTMMYKAGPFPFTEVCANYLNNTIGRPRGLSGDYLYQVPAKVEVELRACDGSLVEGARVDAYQLQSRGELAGYIAGSGPRDSLYSSSTGPDGRCELINQEAPARKTPMGYDLRPNIFGNIATDGSNGLILLRLALGDVEEFHFVRLFDCNLGWIQGDRDSHVIGIQTNFGAKNAPMAPLTTAIFMDARTSPLPDMQVSWPPGPDVKRIDEYRVFRKTGLGDDVASPFTIVGTIRKINRRWVRIYEGPYFDPAARTLDDYSLDTFFSVASVDRDGRQGSLSPPGYMAYDKYALKFALDQDAAFITLGGPGPMQMLRWDGRVGTHPYGIRAVAFPGYQPHNAGIAFTSDHRMVCTDPANHVLGFYSSRGDLEELIPKRDYWPGFASDEPGEFYDPVDVAVDDKGQLYVADRGNNRVQILDAQGAFIGLLDEKFRFDHPHAVAYSNGHLCVTDHDGTRIREYDLTKAPPVMVRELTDLLDADRGIVSPLGRIYTTGRERFGVGQGVIIWGKGDDAKPQQVVTDVDMGKVHSPRGMYFYKLSDSEQYAYFVNMFPFDVRRIKLDSEENAPKSP